MYNLVNSVLHHTYFHMLHHIVSSHARLLAKIHGQDGLLTQEDADATRDTTGVTVDEVYTYIYHIISYCTYMYYIVSYCTYIYHIILYCTYIYCIISYCTTARKTPRDHPRDPRGGRDSGRDARHDRRGRLHVLFHKRT